MKLKNLKDLRSYFGAVNQFTKLIPGLAQKMNTLGTLRKKDKVIVRKNTT